MLPKKTLCLIFTTFITSGCSFVRDNPIPQPQEPKMATPHLTQVTPIAPWDSGTRIFDPNTQTEYGCIELDRYTYKMKQRGKKPDESTINELSSACVEYTLQYTKEFSLSLEQ